MSQQTTIAGRYEIAALIGQGGMGAVYRALDTKTGETVAIKSLKSEVVEGNPDLVERFTREAEVLRRLNHPSIVAILDAIEDNNQYHIIMEYVSGGSLRDVLRKQGQLPVARVLEIALDLADALTRTHRLKIIHRDIKPANVLLAEDGTPRLTDFGVAHLDDLSRVTQTGSVIGTYAYLSPEACNGELQDERADIWSFGVVLFEMLAGKNPFDQGSPAQTLMAILNSLVPTLSEFRPDVPPSLEVLINRMLSKSKEDRIDSVRQVGAELEAILRSLDTQARANVRDILPATSGSRFTSATPTPAALPFSAEPDEANTPASTPSTKTPFSDATPNSYTPSEIRLQADTGSRIPIQMHSTESGQRIFVLRSGPSLWGLIALLVVGVGAVALALFAIRQQNPGVATATPVSTESAAIVVVPTTEEATIAPTLTVAPSNTPGVRIGLLPQAVRTTGAQMPYVLTAQAGMDMAATRSVEMTQTATAASPTPLAVAIAVQRVAPVAADEFMVLVAQPEAFGGNERNVARFIISDLRQSLEEDVPFSQIRVREYPAVITSEDEALAAADANGATMVIWGNYDDDGVELTIQLGVTDALPHVQMERAQLEQVMNVRVRLDSERRQSVVPQVLSILGLLEIADGNAYEAMRTVAVMDAIEVEGGEIVGDSVAANTHRFYQHYLDDTIQAIEDIDTALELDASNPLLYASRSLANQRMGDFDEGRRSAETALRLGPPGWTLPLYLLSNITLNPTDQLELFDLIVQLRPDDWFAVNFRGAMRYHAGDLEGARADLDRAIELGPNANFPYAYAALVAVRQGRIEDARELINTMLQEYPQPAFVDRIVRATFGDEVVNVLGAEVAAFGNLALGRYEQTLAILEPALEDFGDVPDFYVMQGIAYCNLGQYTAAATAYSRVLSLDPDYAFARLLRADTLLHLGQNQYAIDDLDILQAALETHETIDPQFDPYLEAVRSRQFDCTNLFGVNIAAAGMTTDLVFHDATPTPSSPTFSLNAPFRIPTQAPE